MKQEHQLTAGVVDDLRVTLAMHRISVTAAADALGLNRTSLSLMLNDGAPMRKAYGLALQQVVAQKIVHRGY